MTTPTPRIAIGSAAIALIVLASLWFLPFTQPATPTEQTPAEVRETLPLSDAIRTGTRPRPPVTASTTIKALAKTKGFQALLSYTETGFEPREVTIHTGETVRFTNNSDSDMWIAAAAAGGGETIYPSISNGCGDSELDSCSVIHPQDFWEFTFAEKGTWRVANILESASNALVHVE
jgi:plastocyanin